MHYAHPQPTLPRTRTLLAPMVALVIGLAGATGGYALLDDDDVSAPPSQVSVADSPIQPGEGGTVKNEASVAAAVGGAVAGPSTEIKNEAATAAAIGGSATEFSGQTKDEAATAAAIGGSASEFSGQTKDEAATAAAVGGSATEFSGQTKDEAATAAAIAPSGQESLPTDDQGPQRIHPRGSGFVR